MEQKSQTAEREEKALALWKENNIFQKTLEKPSPKGEFVFYDGPPFATGLPHYGSLLSSIVKDVFPRYKTMRGYHVRRRWGWDCHGLPIENMIEKELGIKTKKEIETMGIDVFNEACRASVLRYADAWEKYVDRIGRWVEYKDAYKTMDVTYMESVWWALKRLHDKKLLYEGRKVLLYCPHCETPLAKAEVAMDNSYKDVTEESVYVKFKIKNPEKVGLNGDVYILAWTTTPWTLPGNVALAVGSDVEYVLQDDNVILAKSRVEHISEVSQNVEKSFKGSELVGLEYEPLFKIDAVANSGKKAWYVTDADFVTTEEGTGVVHTAVIYGEDDYQLGLERDLPMVPLLDAGGHFNEKAPEFIKGKYFKGAESAIKEDLEKRGLLFKREMNTHSYPHCHRCDTPLLYNAITSWFINIQKVKNRLIRLNKKVNWIPEHLKFGRFLHTVTEAPDWTISRNRYWASPLPIWKCDSCSKMKVIGSVDELKKHTKTSGNKYFVIRHGEAENNLTETNSSYLGGAELNHHVTEKGKEAIRSSAQRVKDIDVIITSPFTRTKETADLFAEEIDLDKKNIIVDKRIREFETGSFDNKHYSVYNNNFSSTEERFHRKVDEAETLTETRCRMGEFLYSLEEKYKGKRILIVSHGDPLWLLKLLSLGQTPKMLDGIPYSEKGDIEKLSFIPIPHNADYELDLHRPYIDAVELSCECGHVMRRIPEVVDGWVESGSMPFAEYHYPFENKRVFKKRSPGDFISEYIGQTRTWFYYMHVISGTLFRKPSFKNVVTTGNILAGDGSKMSKSKGNYTDPLENLDKYGADALRYYLMTSPLMQAEDARFLDDDLREAHNRVINILSNVATFYGLYADDKDTSVVKPSSENVLDVWIVSRLGELIKETTENLDKYDTIRAGRPIRDFVDDLSTWYVRRSRDRLKTDEHARITLRFVLSELSKVIAPFMPFIAEHVYQSVRSSSDVESVHLEMWPKGDVHVNGDVLKNMEVVRDIVSRALEARASSGLKIRQPLARLTISTDIPEAYLELIRDEINVKGVTIDIDMAERVHLDTNLTDELKEEGEVREYVRTVQGLRKKTGLKPSDVIEHIVQTDEKGQTFLTKYQDTILSGTNASGFLFTATGDEAVEVSLGSVSIKKV